MSTTTHTAGTDFQRVTTEAGKVQKAKTDAADSFPALNTHTNSSMDAGSDINDDERSAAGQSNLSDNCLEGILLRKGDPYSVHPAAKRFRKVEAQRVKLRKSLKEIGQRDDAVGRFRNGIFELYDGSTRTEELFDLGQPVRCRILQDAELEGQTIEDWIMKANLHDGRDLNDAQRTVAALDVYADRLLQWETEANARKTGGKPVDPSKKFDVASFLAERVNVSKNKMEKTLRLQRLPSGTELLEAVWNGISISTALKIADEKDAEKRAILVGFAVKGDKKGLKIAMASSTVTRDYDRFGTSIPPSLLDNFAQTAQAETNIAEAEEVATKFQDTNASSFIDEAKRLRTDVLPDLAYAMCDWCEWSGQKDQKSCPFCKGKRFLTLREFEAARGTEKKKFIVVPT